MGRPDPSELAEALTDAVADAESWAIVSVDDQDGAKLFYSWQGGEEVPEPSTGVLLGGAMQTGGESIEKMALQEAFNRGQDEDLEAAIDELSDTGPGFQ